MTHKRNSITHLQAIKLGDWIRQQDIPNSKTLTTYTGIARAATAALGVVYGDAAVKNAMRAVEVDLPKPPPPPPPPPAPVSDATQIARELVLLLRSMGKEPSAATLQIAQLAGPLL